MNRFPFLPPTYTTLPSSRTKPNAAYWTYLDDLATRWNEARTSIFNFNDADALHQELITDYRVGVKGIGFPSNIDLDDDPSTHALIVRVLVRLYRLGIAPQMELQRLRSQLLWEMWKGLEPGLKKVEGLERDAQIARTQVELWKAKREEPWAWVSPDESVVKVEAQWRVVAEGREKELKELRWVKRLEKEYVGLQDDVTGV